MQLVVIGAGPGGEAAARYSASRGAEVCLVEKNQVGGLCLNRGCVPSKTLLERGRLLYELKQAASSGILTTNGGLLNWSNLVQQKEDVVGTIRERLKENLKRSGVRFFSGEACFSSPRSLRVRNAQGKEEELTFDRCMIATGSDPSFPPPFAPYQQKLLDSDTVLELSKPPSRLVIIGGGAVGCEYACLFRELGSEISLIEKTAGLLPGEDPLIVQTLTNSFKKRGIQIYLSTTVESLEHRSVGNWKLVLSTGETREAEYILVCTGRTPRVENLGLEKAHVRFNPRGISVNERLETSNPSIYAVGDVNGLSLLAHAAQVQGEVAAENALGGNQTYQGELVPRCLYTWPEVASVGLWAYQAQTRGISTRVQRSFFAGSSKAMAHGDTEGFIQIVTDAKTDVLLGAQIIGPQATELIHIFSVALFARMSREALRSVIYAHPTLSENVRDALNKA